MMKAGDGRPRSNNRVQTRVVAFRVTPDVEAELSDAAANDGFESVGGWAKALAMRAVGHTDIDRKVLRGLIGELGKNGSNLNQMARVANTTGRLLDEAELQRAVRATLDLQRRISARLS